MTLRFAEIWSERSAAGVEYIVVGAFAVGAHGNPRASAAMAGAPTWAVAVAYRATWARRDVPASTGEHMHQVEDARDLDARVPSGALDLCGEPGRW